MLINLKLFYFLRKKMKISKHKPIQRQQFFMKLFFNYGQTWAKDVLELYNKQ